MSILYDDDDEDVGLFLGLLGMIVLESSRSNRFQGWAPSFY